MRIISNPIAFSCSIPIDVTLRLFTHVMRDAVHFDDNLGGRTVKIHDVVTDRMLTAEYHAFRGFSKQVPQEHLG